MNNMDHMRILGTNGILMDTQWHTMYGYSWHLNYSLLHLSQFDNFETIGPSGILGRIFNSTYIRRKYSFLEK